MLGHIRIGRFMQAFLLVGVGGALGSMARYGVAEIVGRFWRANFPLSTLIINIIGSVIMGLFVGLLARLTPTWGAEMRLFFAVGVLGGFTTFSTFSLDIVSQMERGEILPALLYIGLSVAVSIIGLYLGLLAVRVSPL